MKKIVLNWLFLFFVGLDGTSLAHGQDRERTHRLAVQSNRTGQILSVDSANNKALMRISGSTFQINLAQVDEELRRQIVAAAGSSTPIEVSPIEALTFLSDDSGIENTSCREERRSNDGLLEAAQSSTSQDQFLLSLGSSLPHATFVYQSHSMQNDGVNMQNPRVVRTSNDGKQIISYVCDPNSAEYGTIEMMTWNDNTKNFDFAHLNFRGAQANTSGHLQRNPSSCISCHGQGNNSKPFWGTYLQWPGVYGSADDLISDRSSEEYRNFKEFKQRYQTSPCLSTLPWPEGSGNRQDIYPYTDTRFDLNFTKRPNARMSYELGSLYSESLFGRFNEDPLWPIMQYYALADFLECRIAYPWSKDSRTLEERASRWLPELNSETPLPNTVRSGNSFITRYSLIRGMRPQDWTLEPNQRVRSGEVNPLDYNPGYGSLQDYVIGQTIQQVRTQSPALTKGFASARNEGLMNGEILSCRNSAAAPVLRTSELRNQGCRSVMAKIAELEQTDPAACAQHISGHPLASGDNGVMQVMGSISQDLENGRSLVVDRCSYCHSGERGNNFFRTEEGLEQHLKSGSGMQQKIMKQLQSGNMPAEGPALTRDERRQVERYLEYLRTR